MRQMAPQCAVQCRSCIVCTCMPLSHPSACSMHMQRHKIAVDFQDTPPLIVLRFNPGCRK